MTTYNVVARRWKRGWELHIEGAGVTQVRRLGEAEGMVRDYVESLTGVDASDAIVVIRPEVGDGLDQEARVAREAVAAADRMTREAAARSRKVARDLRSAGLSGREIAAILDVSAQRVSQLLKSLASTSGHTCNGWLERTSNKGKTWRTVSAAHTVGSQSADDVYAFTSAYADGTGNQVRACFRVSGSSATHCSAAW